jgi:hypothetical protein
MPIARSPAGVFAIEDVVAIAIFKLDQGSKIAVWPDAPKRSVTYSR